LSGPLAPCRGRFPSVLGTHSHLFWPPRGPTSREECSSWCPPTGPPGLARFSLRLVATVCALAARPSGQAQSELGPALTAVGNANRHSLRDRLNALTAELGPLQSILGSHPADDKKAVVAARNDLAHRALAPVPQRQVSSYARQLEILVLANIYKRLGVNDEAIRRGLAGLTFSLRFLSQP
jgi:hypothetical protein